MGLTTDEAFCIRVWDWSETSQTVSLFSRDHGVIRCVAKGAKRENAKFSGGLEVLTRGEMIASVKTGDSMSLLTSWDLLEVFPASRRTLSSFYAGMTLLDVVHHSVTDHDPHPEIFDALVANARLLGEPADDQRAVFSLLWTSIDQTGHRPELHADVATGAPLTPAPAYVFSPRLGGLTTDSGAGDGPRWRVRHETVEFLRGHADGRASAAPESLDRATRLLAMYFREVFAADPATFRRLLGDAGAARAGR